MAPTEWYIVAITVIGLLIWLRGCIRLSIGDCALGLVIGAVACVMYFVLFSLTRTDYLGAMILGGFLLSMLPFRRLFARPLGKGLAAVVVLLVAGAGLFEYKLISMGNALLVIEPYRTGKGWRFDEPLLRLKGEPFVQGIPEMIDKMVVDIPGSDKSVRLIFSQRPFPGAQHRLDRRREQDGGNWYYNEEYRMEGWLCPALFKFFSRAPRHIYIRAEAKQ